VNAPFDADGALAREVLDAPGIPQPLPPGAPLPPLQEPMPSTSASEPTAEHIPEFDPRYREPFEGLLYLGHLHDTAVFHGHKFRLVTPSSSERLQIGLAIREYDGTVGFDFAYSCALVAAYLVQVDGQDLPQPITNDPKDVALQHRFEWVLSTLKKPVIDFLFDRCLVLDGQVREVLEAMGKASG
jgi:hypothetical protein